MNKDMNRNRIFNRRAGFLAAGILVIILIIIAKLYYLQIYQADKYTTLADSNRISMRLLPSPRGIIFDRNGIPLAINHHYYHALIISEQATGQIRNTLDNFSRIIPLSAENYDYVLSEVKNKRSFVPVKVMGNLSWEDMAKIEVNLPDLAGITIDEGLARYYPYPFDTAHIIGYMGAVTEADKEKEEEPLFSLPEFKKGKTGLESVFDKQLRGKAGSRQIEVNVLGREIRELSRLKANNGEDLHLSLDLRVQKAARAALGTESGAVVAVDVNTGEILALVSNPSFDTNMFSKGISEKDWKILSSDEHKPLINKAIAGEYSPGSTFKMIVALAALEAGIITAETTVNCNGHLDFGNHRFHCWKKSGHGEINLKQALAVSCDVYFYEIARRVGIDKISEMAKRFGLGHKEGIELPFEKAGLIPTKSWKRRIFGKPWQLGETILVGIGQSYVQLTPLQMAMMTARLVNGGYFVRPTLIKKADDNEQKPERIKINKFYLQLVNEGMEAVVNEKYGTARNAGIDSNLGKMGGKTGTTQVKRITREERESSDFNQKEIPWKERSHALFVGYAPLDKPKYAVAVIVEHGGGGSAVAAPIASQILEYMLLLDKRDKQQRIKGKSRQNTKRKN